MLPAIAMAPMPAEISVPVAIAAHVKVFEYASQSSVSWGSITGSIHSEMPSKKSAILWSPVSLLDGTTARRASSIEAVHALVVDVDHGETWDDVLCNLDAMTWWAYTTHSHLSADVDFAPAYLPVCLPACPLVQRLAVPSRPDPPPPSPRDPAGRAYYANDANGTTSWTHPAAGPAPAPALPPGWRELRDPTGRAYYANDATGTTAWTRP